MQTLKQVYVVGGFRTPFVKSFTSFQSFDAHELMLKPVKELVERFHLQGKTAGDVALGSVLNLLPRWNLAREIVLDSGLNPSTPAFNIQRACGTGLEAATLLVAKAAVGVIDFGIAGGVDSNSDLPFLFHEEARKKWLAFREAKSLSQKIQILSSFRPRDFQPDIPAAKERRTGLSMGEHCELMVKEWKISRQAQDELALRSHQNGVKAYDEGFYKDLVVEFAGLRKDGILRSDSSLEKLGKLKSVFDPGPEGTLTAGNSTPLSDGAACVLVANEEALKKHKWEALARVVDFQAAAVDFPRGEGLLMAPTIAVARLLERNKLSLQSFDFYEIHEAFAGQVLCTLKAWEDDNYCKNRLGMPKALGPIERSKMNIKGGSVALGHPFAATGARILGSLGKILKKQSKARALISICTAGGMGVAAILESP